MLQVGVKTGYTIRSELSLGCREGLQVLRYCKAEKGSGATVSLNECHTCRHENQQSRNPTERRIQFFFHMFLLRKFYIILQSLWTCKHVGTHRCDEIESASKCTVLILRLLIFSKRFFWEFLKKNALKLRVYYVYNWRQAKRKWRKRSDNWHREKNRRTEYTRSVGYIFGRGDGGKEKEKENDCFCFENCNWERKALEEN